ncbi:unnamed protein product [Chilo suppressalis]|uniref:Pentacotripeptide-repeat region of PRORP domain-containing protein n=1 Tax=Chilo suppressalis TaxID=168631 RepID=A0ABN8B054_CHISP|nr:unnamed protein product [Chilo suppressalis]
MALSYMRTLRITRTVTIIHRNLKSVPVAQASTVIKPVQSKKTEDKFVYLEDPDVFGTLSKNSMIPDNDEFEDEGDIKEQEFLSNLPMKSRKLTIKQYSDLIKQYLSHKRLKEALDILEVRMLTEDRVKPENYIYNILIGACADVGYTKKAFKLFNDMKRRALKPTGDTYTCLFHACANSPWPEDGLKYANALRELINQKGIELNITIYNSMIKAFGRCGDLPAAFKIVDEMIAKKIKIRVHTYNHLLHACISDKKIGLRHALVVWRKMLTTREKPNLFSFNLMLKCVQDCNLGTKADIEELISILQSSIAITDSRSLQIRSEVKLLNMSKPELISENLVSSPNDSESKVMNNSTVSGTNNYLELVSDNTITILDKNSQKKISIKKERMLPNLLSKLLQMQQVLALKEIHTVQDRFAVIGGQEDFIKEMEVYSVKPDIKTFTQMITLLDNTSEAENKLLETMKTFNIKADIDFYNILIKKRCLRGDYDAAFDVKTIIEGENAARKKSHPLKKKLRLKFNVMTYGVLAMACQTKDSAEKLLNEMNENQLKVNIEILGTLLKKGAIKLDFDYVIFIMKRVKEENLNVNATFLKHLQTLYQICKRKNQLQDTHIVDAESKKSFERAFRKFSTFYHSWLNEVDVEGAKSEHPWQQFRENYPETVQRSNVVIREPKKFYKRNRRFVKYAPRV